MAVRGKLEQYNCRSCNGLFTARVADRKRGWAQYCSKACKQVIQEEAKKIWTTLSK
jgi:hypothetical protein